MGDRMNQAMLNCRLGVADELDRYVAWWQKYKGEKPKQLHITKAQRAQLEIHAAPNARLDDWKGIPLKVLGA